MQSNTNVRDAEYVTEVRVYTSNGFINWHKNTEFSS